MPWPGGARPGRGGPAMDEVFAVHSRLAPERLAQLTRKSDSRGALQLASHLLALAASGLGLWLAWGSWWGVPLFVVHGVLLNWLYAAQRGEGPPSCGYLDYLAGLALPRGAEKEQPS